MKTLVAMMVMGLAMGSTAEAAKARPAKQLRLTALDGGKRFALKKSQSLSITLPQNASTGYRWNVVSTSKAFGYPKEEYRLLKNGPVGGGGALELTWKKAKGLPVGLHTVKLAYGRPWEQKPLKNLLFKFDVK